MNPALDGPGDVSCLVPLKDLSIINYSNVQRYGIKPSSNSGYGNIYFNNVPASTYAFFESRNNSMGFSVTPEIPPDIGGILTFV